MSLLPELRRTLAEAEIAADEAAAARASIDPDTPDSITYYGSRVERELARLTEEVARTGVSGAVDGAAATLAAMLARLGQLTAPAKKGLLARFRRRPAGVDEATIARVETELDRLAAELESHSTPLMTERLTLERRSAEIQDALATLTAHVAGAVEALDAIGEQSLTGRDLLGRVQELLMARTVALQGLATLSIMVDNRARILERSQFALRHALPLWHQQAELVRRELAGSAEAARARLTAANAELADALGEGDDSPPPPP